MHVGFFMYSLQLFPNQWSEKQVSHQKYLGINLINMQVFCHCALALILRVRAQSVDLSCKAAVTSFYMFIWKASESLSLVVLTG